MQKKCNALYFSTAKGMSRMRSGSSAVKIPAPLNPEVTKFVFPKCHQTSVQLFCLSHGVDETRNTTF